MRSIGKNKLDAQVLRAHKSICKNTFLRYDLRETPKIVTDIYSNEIFMFIKREREKKCAHIQLWCVYRIQYGGASTKPFSIVNDTTP